VFDSSDQTHLIVWEPSERDHTPKHREQKNNKGVAQPCVIK
jgi:hypothetical protein